jgi:hypothetical protein
VPANLAQKSRVAPSPPYGRSQLSPSLVTYRIVERASEQRGIPEE